MKEQEIKDWFAYKMQYASTLVDYLMSVGQNNRLLQAIPHTGTVSYSVGANPNRVAVAVTCNFSIAALAANIAAHFSILDDNNNAFIITAIIKHEADVAAVTPSPISYTPFFATVLQIGPAIQQNLFVTIQAGTQPVTLTEVILNPKCCEYIGGMR